MRKCALSANCVFEFDVVFSRPVLWQGVKTTVNKDKKMATERPLSSWAHFLLSLLKFALAHHQRGPFFEKRKAYFEDKRSKKPRKREQRVSQFTVNMDVDENGNQSGDEAMDIDDLRKFLFFLNNKLLLIIPWYFLF